MSDTLPHHISGPGHLTFWTLSGSRLTHRPGRFLLRPVASIEAATETGGNNNGNDNSNGNSKVLSSTHWGNLLVWDAADAAIELEMTRKDGSNCHDGNVHALVAEEGGEEVITVGADGWIRVWDLANVNVGNDVDEADNAFFRVDPMNEVEVEAGAVLVAIAKSKQAGEQNIWFIQVSPNYTYADWNSVPSYTGRHWQHMEGGPLLLAVDAEAAPRPPHARRRHPSPVRYLYRSKLALNKPKRMLSQARRSTRCC